MIGMTNSAENSAITTPLTALTILMNDPDDFATDRFVSNCFLTDNLMSNGTCS